MIRIYIILFTCLFIQTSWAQTASSELNDLYKGLSKLPKQKSFEQKKAEIEYYRKIAKFYVAYQDDSSRLYTNRCFEKAALLNWPLGKALATQLKAYYYDFNFISDSAEMYYAEALKLMVPADSGKYLYEMYEDIADFYTMRSDYDSSNAFLLKSLDVAIKAQNREWLNRAYIDLELNARSVGDTVQAEQYKALYKQEEVEHPEQLVQNFDLANRYYFEYKYEESLKYFFLSLADCRKNFSSVNAVYNLISISGVYAELKQMAAAEKYLKMAVKEAEFYNNSNTLIFAESEIANFYRKQGNDSAAKQMFLKVLDRIEYPQYNVATFESVCTKLGTIYLSENNPKEAKAIFTRLIENNIFTNPSEQSEAYIGLAKSYCLQQSPNFSLAKLYLDTASDLMLVDNMRVFLRELKKGYLVMYESMGDYKKAFEVQSELMAINDSILKDETTEKVSEMDAKYQSAEKENSIMQLQNENLKQNQTIYLSLLGLVAAVLIAASLALAYRKSRKHTKYLEAEDEHKKMMLQEVQHRTNNNLQLMSTILALQSSTVTDKNIKPYLKQSESRIHSMTAMHELLHQKDEQLQVNMNEYLAAIIHFHNDLHGQRIKIVADIAPITMAAKQALPIALLTNELITNSLKHAFTDKQSGEIQVGFGLDTTTNQYHLKLEDNGKGLPEKAFQSGQGSTGTTIINILVQQLTGKLIATNDKGASIDIFFPKSAFA